VEDDIDKGTRMISKRLERNILLQQRNWQKRGGKTGGRARGGQRPSRDGGVGTLTLAKDLEWALIGGDGRDSTRARGEGEN